MFGVAFRSRFVRLGNCKRWMDDEETVKIVVVSPANPSIFHDVHEVHCVK